MNKYKVTYRETWTTGFEREVIVYANSITDINNDIENEAYSEIISETELDPTYLDTEITNIEEYE